MPGYTWRLVHMCTGEGVGLAGNRCPQQDHMLLLAMEENSVGPSNGYFLSIFCMFSCLGNVPKIRERPGVVMGMAM